MSETCLPVERLWEYSRNSDFRTLLKSEFDHLAVCEDCVAVLWTCNTSASLDQAIDRLKEHGLS